MFLSFQFNHKFLDLSIHFFWSYNLLSFTRFFLFFFFSSAFPSLLHWFFVLSFFFKFFHWIFHKFMYIGIFSFERNMIFSSYPHLYGSFANLIFFAAWINWSWEGRTIKGMIGNKWMIRSMLRWMAEWSWSDDTVRDWDEDFPSKLLTCWNFIESRLMMSNNLY